MSMFDLSTAVVVSMFVNYFNSNSMKHIFPACFRKKGTAILFDPFFSLEASCAYMLCCY